MPRKRQACGTTIDRASCRTQADVWQIPDPMTDAATENSPDNVALEEEQQE